MHNASARAVYNRLVLALEKTSSDGGAPPLVMIHGFLCAGLFFRPVVSALSSHNDIITLDLPGFGESRDCGAVDSIAAMAQQVQDTLAANGIRRYHLLGHSMGGMVALQCALEQPAAITSLIIYASNSSGDLPDRFETFAQSRRRLREDFAGSKRRICATWFRQGASHPDFHLLEQCAQKVALAAAQKAIDAMAAFDARARLQELAMPVLIISAEHDRTYSLACQEQLLKSIPQARQRIIKNCAHCAHLEDGERFAGILRDWLSAHK